MVRTTLTISGMSCVHCKRAVFTALSGVPGVSSAEVSIGRAEVEHDDPVSLDTLRAAVAEAGYDVTDATQERRVLPQLP